MMKINSTSIIEDLRQEIKKLALENKELKKLLIDHGISIKDSNQSSLNILNLNITNENFSIEEKIKLYRSLFRGREDIYAKRWEAKNGHSGYSPACANEWNPMFVKNQK